MHGSVFLLIRFKVTRAQCDTGATIVRPFSAASKSSPRAHSNFTAISRIVSEHYPGSWVAIHILVTRVRFFLLGENIMKKFKAILFLAGLIHLSFGTSCLADMNVDNGDGSGEAIAQLSQPLAAPVTDQGQPQASVAASE